MDYVAFATRVVSFTPLHLFLSAMFGAFILYVLNRLNERQPFSFFRALGIEIGTPKSIFFDMVVSSALGAGVVLFIIRPSSVTEAMTSGLGLTGMLSAFGKST